MRYTSILAAVAASAMITFTGLPVTGDVLIAKAYAQGSQTAKARRAANGRSIELRRGGYYSYADADATRRSNAHLAPMVDLQSRAGPFDSGFFFDSGLTPHWWNNAPYPN